ncbi:MULTISPECIES: 2,3-diphosphoglycerate-dependent phosphoglycerate mutase [Burkholderiaceae]|jgi:2,3-bisphosphoglycerate-dependent phosphoglycerate mutase|uniref:2,3-bisphosphoglycerate-dependent phosphoglycerate mutase n=1 Tax=Burkholderia vietnamiensis TaxID=60552 RepID=A0AAW7TD29_BURVI|nr:MULTISPECIES: 2,3-bisphosphoglycerate-dependent phosphoglycerate mutase [Burkholderiaceae]MDN7799425.1 2,3-bisphosphoglycerate-dependent phosphoglycerate mutase [Burkholderia vietnamiensis]RFU44268.1 2,3-bisphosphoglycerate-dependent phosphoglycerate mutase [Paraburkholderia sp. DHOC27]
MNASVPGTSCNAARVAGPPHSERRGAFSLVVVRHGESVWNREHRFTGWTDIDLTAQGEQQARHAGEMLALEKWEFDLAFTSVLKRSIRSQWLMLEALDQTWLPVFTDWRLNERHYGDLTGHTHAEVIAAHGSQRVLEWRRSFRARPLPMPMDDPRDPTLSRRYKNVLSTRLPRTESLSDTTMRVGEFWEEMLKPSIRSGMRILVCAHGNSLRALVKVLDSVPDAEIAHLDIPNGVPLIYWFDTDVRPLGRCFLDLPHPAESNIL